MIDESEGEIRDAFMRCRKSLDFGDSPQGCFSMLARRETVPSNEELESCTLTRYQALNAVAWLDVFDKPDKLTEKDRNLFNKMWTAMSKNNNTPTCRWKEFYRVCSQVLDPASKLSEPTNGFTPIKPAALNFDDTPSDSNVTIKWPRKVVPGPVHEPHPDTTSPPPAQPTAHLTFGDDDVEKKDDRKEGISPPRPQEGHHKRTPDTDHLHHTRQQERYQKGVSDSDHLYTRSAPKSEISPSRLSNRLERLVLLRQQQLLQHQHAENPTGAAPNNSPSNTYNRNTSRGRSMTPTKSAMRSRSSESEKKYQKVDIQDPKPFPHRDSRPTRDSSSDSSSNHIPRHAQKRNEQKTEQSRQPYTRDADRRRSDSRTSSSSSSASSTSEKRPARDARPPPAKYKNEYSQKQSPKTTDYNNSKNAEKNKDKDKDKKHSREKHTSRRRSRSTSSSERSKPQSASNQQYHYRKRSVSSSSSSSKSKRRSSRSKKPHHVNPSPVPYQQHQHQEFIMSEAHLKGCDFSASRSSSSSGMRKSLNNEVFSTTFRVKVDFGTDIGYQDLQGIGRHATCTFKDSVEAEILSAIASGVSGDSFLHRVAADSSTTVYLEFKVYSTTASDAQHCYHQIASKLQTITNLELEKTSVAVSHVSKRPCSCRLLASNSTIGEYVNEVAVPPRHEVRMLIDEDISQFEPKPFTAAVEKYLRCEPQTFKVSQYSPSGEGSTSITLSVPNSSARNCNLLCKQAKDRTSTIHAAVIPFIECDYFRDYAESSPGTDDYQGTSHDPYYSSYHRNQLYRRPHSPRGEKWDGFGYSSYSEQRSFSPRSPVQLPSFKRPTSRSGSPSSFYSLLSSGRLSPSVYYAKSNPSSPRVASPMSSSRSYAKSMVPLSFKEPPNSPRMSIRSPRSKPPPSPTGRKVPPLGGRSLSPSFHTPPQSPSSPTARQYRPSSQTIPSSLQHRFSDVPDFEVFARSRSEKNAKAALRSASPDALRSTSKAQRFVKKNNLSKLFG